MKSDPAYYADYFTTPKGKTGWLIFSERGLYSMMHPGPHTDQPPGTILKRTPETKILKTYYAGKKVHFNAKIDYSGFSEFERKVLHECSSIKYGATLSYGQLALKTGRENAFRAVGNALNKNRLPVIIPCHRVIRSDGSIGGFASGTTLKKKLIGMETK